ncbi:HAD hydrolase family protein [Planosporangium thailandense]|uniref:HAD hydrolase family protein n=1 Tax=Planosporangium thailandense TaxID=765197 RepID=A0ABX0Y8L5_9ACTN|nr:HAD hydrolase family protein [Planosporangium thailandense]NJC73752.1 HAD hydrolase family protein [Planosporangium thailandense]
MRADVDGTLMTRDKVLTDRVVTAVHALHTADILFAITSGRPIIRRDAPARPRSRSLRRPVDLSELW